jgi:hypothetical protein
LPLNSPCGRFGRPDPKDQLFLATHKDALEQLLKKPD